MTIRGLVWTAERIEHIESRHGVTAEEVEEACEVDYWIRRGRRGSYLAYGQTYSGRYLLVVLWHQGGGQFKVITARDMTDVECRLYQRR